MKEVEEKSFDSLREVLRLARAVRHHDAPARILRHGRRLDGLRDGADLIHLQRQHLKNHIYF